MCGEAAMQVCMYLRQEACQQSQGISCMTDHQLAIVKRVGVRGGDGGGVVKAPEHIHVEA